MNFTLNVMTIILSTTDEGKLSYNEIVKKKTQDLYTDKNLNEQIYQNVSIYIKSIVPYLQAFIHTTINTL